MWGNQKGGEIFKMKGGNLIFRVEFRDRKGQKWGLSETNLHKFLQKFACGSKYYDLFGHLLCILCLNGRKESF